MEATEFAEEQVYLKTVSALGMEPGLEKVALKRRKMNVALSSDIPRRWTTRVVLLGFSGTDLGLA